MDQPVTVQGIRDASLKFVPAGPQLNVTLLPELCQRIQAEGPGRYPLTLHWEDQTLIQGTLVYDGQQVYFEIDQIIAEGQ